MTDCREDDTEKKKKGKAHLQVIGLFLDITVATIQQTLALEREYSRSINNH